MNCTHTLTIALQTACIEITFVLTSGITGNGICCSGRNISVYGASDRLELCNKQDNLILYVTIKTGKNRLTLTIYCTPLELGNHRKRECIK